MLSNYNCIDCWSTTLNVRNCPELMDFFHFTCELFSHKTDVIALTLYFDLKLIWYLLYNWRNEMFELIFSKLTFYKEWLKLLIYIWIKLSKKNPIQMNSYWFCITFKTFTWNRQIKDTFLDNKILKYLTAMVVWPFFLRDKNITE